MPQTTIDQGNGTVVGVFQGGIIILEIEQALAE
jgi:hypothetical protein